MTMMIKNDKNDKNDKEDKDDKMIEDSISRSKFIDLICRSYNS